MRAQSHRQQAAYEWALAKRSGRVPGSVCGARGARLSCVCARIAQ
jgi:hypothetical protein